MNLKKMFQMQKKLDDRINYTKYDRLEKKVVGFIVETNEWANENRWFKFWSVNQLPHTSAVRVPTMMEEDKEYYNPMLEEFVDGLHFILSLGLEIDFDCDAWELEGEVYLDLTEQFMSILKSAIKFSESPNEDHYVDLIQNYIGLGEMIGFSWCEIEQAYFEKNAINHQRQESGY